MLVMQLLRYNVIIYSHQPTSLAWWGTRLFSFKSIAVPASHYSKKIRPYGEGSTAATQIFLQLIKHLCSQTFIPSKVPSRTLVKQSLSTVNSFIRLNYSIQWIINDRHNSGTKKRWRTFQLFLNADCSSGHSQKSLIHSHPCRQPYQVKRYSIRITSSVYEYGLMFG